MAYLIAEALKLAGHFNVRLRHGSEPMWGLRSCGRGNGCPSCESPAARWGRMAHDMFKNNDQVPPPPPP